MISIPWQEGSRILPVVCIACGLGHSLHQNPYIWNLKPDGPIPLQTSPWLPAPVFCLGRWKYSHILSQGSSEHLCSSTTIAIEESLLKKKRRATNTCYISYPIHLKSPLISATSEATNFFFLHGVQQSWCIYSLTAAHLRLASHASIPGRERV